MIEIILIEKFRKARSQLVILDYDGTLVDYATMPDKAIPSEHLLNVLLKIIAKPQTKVIVITGRKHQDIDKFLGHLPIDIIAEHGAMRKENGKWETHLNNDRLWKDKVLPLLNRMTLTCPNSFVEEKHFSLAWHYRNAETNTGYIHSRELIRLLKNVIRSCNLKVVDGNMVVEVLAAETNKGAAIQYLIETNSYDCILCMGDDSTDEDMFESLLKNKNAITIKIGPGKTFAKYTFGTVYQAIQFLDHLST